jgi:hypothetical protein
MFGSQRPPRLPAQPLLAFVESASQVQSVLNGPDQEQVDAFVALHPEAAWALYEVNKPYLKLEDGYNEQDLCELAQQALDEQQAWADWLDRSLHDHIPEFGEANFCPARLYLYWLKIMFDSLNIRISTLEWALQNWRPRRVLIPTGESVQQRFGWDLTYRDSLYPSVLQHIAKRIGTETAIIGSSRLAAPLESVTAIDFARFTNFLKTQSVSLVRGIGRWITALNTDFSTHDALIVSREYDLAPVWALASKQHIRLASWESLVNRLRPVIKSAACYEARGWMATIWCNIHNSEEFRQPSQPRGYDLWSMVRARLHFWWHVLIPQQWAVYKTVLCSFKTSLPRSVVVSRVNDHVERAVFSAMRTLGIPTYIYQHGGFVGWCECLGWDSSDLLHTQYELTYGRAVSEYFMARRERSNQRLAHPLSVGSSRLDALRKQIRTTRRHRRPVVLLVPNLIPGNDRYLDCGNLPDVTESEIQAAMVSVAHDFPQYDFVFKTFPNQADTPAVKLAGRQGSNCRVVFKAKLPILMAKADLIVLSFPSTALLEALLTDRPILVLADRRSIRLLREARAALSKRVILAESAEEFLESLRKLLLQGAFPPILHPDQSFLEMYGTYINDGNSAQRVLEAVALKRLAPAWTVKIPLAES